MGLALFLQLSALAVLAVAMTTKAAAAAANLSMIADASAPHGARSCGGWKSMHLKKDTKRH